MKEKAAFINAFRDMNLGDTIKLSALVQDAIVRPFYSEWLTLHLPKAD